MTNITTYHSFLLFLIVFLIIGKNVDAQKRALGKPVAFLHPMDTPKYEYSSSKEKEKSAWIVICDRDKAQTFERVNKSGQLQKPKEQLKFRDWFYVSEETDCCIRIFKGKVNHATFKIESGFKDYGWIDKKNILLWTNSLVNSTTKVELKTFLVNRASNIKDLIILEKIYYLDIYSHPHTLDVLENKSLQDIYFVFKKIGNKYLLSKSIKVNPMLNPNHLVGWVEQTRFQVWNNRLCIEPNFHKTAFLERKTNPSFHFIAYNEERSARLHSKMGHRNDHKAIWTNDPVRLNPTQLASDERRLKGNFLRFPILNDAKHDGYFRSGIIGQFVEEGIEEQDIRPTYFAPTAAKLLFHLVEEDEKTGITNEILQKIIKEKYRLYAEVYIPKKIKDANYNSYALILFMTESELNYYIDAIDLLSIDLMKTNEELREGLYRSLTMLIKQYTNYKTIPKTYEIADLRAAIRGSIKNKKTNPLENFALEDILSTRKMSIEQVQEFSTNLVMKTKQLKHILNEGKKHEFSYSTQDNTYYWIPIEYTF